jgi:tetratricopeptide (TPR) repeat protein/tRNA A-37 threonylcarbamoyl transferase component Bud32
MSTPTAVEDVFLSALRKAGPEEREAYLEQACGGDPELRRRVERLLRARAEAGDFLEQPAVQLGATVDPAPGGEGERPDVSPPAEAVGSVIGPYKLLQKLGEGGMGTVWVAEQHQPVKRRVALKVVKPGMDSAQVLRRFEAERQALALMDHNHIAKVFDAGATPSGRPYFVMELVPGVPITRYCDELSLPLRERLGLFVPVCQAIQHAHQKGVIHRDVKPSNVLVCMQDGRQMAKVIDFGVAKALHQKLTDETMMTEFGAIVGTLEYMSPEQAEMSPLGVDTRADVYALGVLLYELLTGTTPLDRRRLKSAALTEMLRLIREEEPPRPSTRLTESKETLAAVAAHRRTEPGRLAKELRGELDWIVMRCLEKDRTRRYETANALARDVERHLADEPVEACPPSAAYRLRKFARRNKTALAIAGLILFCITLVGGIGGWAVRDRDARQREAAHEQQVREAALDEQVKRELDEADALIVQGKWPEALTAVQRMEKLLAAAGRGKIPARLQEIHNDLAMVQRLEDIYAQPKAEEFFNGREQDAAYGRAFADYGIDVASLPALEAAGRIRARRIRQELIRGLDFWSLARKYANNKGPPSWKQLLAVAKAADEDRWRNGLRDALAAEDQNAPQALAASADVRRLPPQTLVLLGRTLREFAPEKALPILREAHWHHPGDLWINDSLGVLCMASLRPPQYDEALRFYTAALSLRPGNPCMMAQVGHALLGKGALEEALATFDKVIELKPDKRDAWWGRGTTYLKLGQPEKALAQFSRVIEQDPKDSRARGYRGWAHNYLHEYDKALADCSRAIELDPNLAWVWRERGIAYVSRMQWDKGLADCSKAIELDPKDAAAWNNRGRAYAGLTRRDKAMTDYTKAIELNPSDAAPWHNRGIENAALKQWDKAIADYTKAIELDPKNARTWGNRGVAYDALAQGEKAIPDFDKAIDLDPKYARAWSNRGLAYARLGQWEKALAGFNKAIELDPGYANAWRNRGRAYHQLNKWDEALADLNKALELGPKLADAWNIRGVVRERLKQWDEAVADASKALELQPDNPMFQNHLAWLLCIRPEPDKRGPHRAVELSEKAVKAQPKNAAFQDTLGVARYRAGDSSGAVTALQEAVKLFDEAKDFEPGAGGSLFFLAMARQKAGHGPEARRAYDRALAWLRANRQALEKNAWAADEMRRFQAEAEEVLGIEKSKGTTSPEESSGR